jgi:hypothetical protein
VRLISGNRSVENAVKTFVPKCDEYSEAVNAAVEEHQQWRFLSFIYGFVSDNSPHSRGKFTSSEYYKQPCGMR